MNLGVGSGTQAEQTGGIMVGYERLLATARATHPRVAAGEFGADMQVELVNDGPVTIPITVRP